MQLAKREKYLVSSAGCVLFLLIVFHFLINPLFEKKDLLKKEVNRKQAALDQIVQMSAEYKALKKGDHGIHKILGERNKGFTLFSFLEQEAAKSDVKDRIKYMKPSISQGSGQYKESMVEMKLEGITLKQLVAYLYRIESQENAIGIKRISVKENKKESGYIDAVLNVLTVQ